MVTVPKEAQPRSCNTNPCSMCGTAAQPCAPPCSQFQYQCSTRQAASAELEVLQRLQGRVHCLLEQADRLVNVCLCHLRPVIHAFDRQPELPNPMLSTYTERACMAAGTWLLAMSLCLHGTRLMSALYTAPHRERRYQTDDVAGASGDGNQT